MSSSRKPLITWRRLLAVVIALLLVFLFVPFEFTKQSRRAVWTSYHLKMIGVIRQVSAYVDNPEDEYTEPWIAHWFYFHRNHLYALGYLHQVEHTIPLSDDMPFWRFCSEEPTAPDCFDGGAYRDGHKMTIVIRCVEPTDIQAWREFFRRFELMILIRHVIGLD